MGRGPKNNERPTPRTEGHAILVAQIKSAQRNIKYGDLVALLRSKHGLGKTAAEQAIKRHYQLMDATKNEWVVNGVSMLVDWYTQIADEAMRAGKYRDAAKAMDSLRTMLKLGAADRIEVTSSETAAKLATLTPEQVELLAMIGHPDTEPEEDEPAVEH